MNPFLKRFGNECLVSGTEYELERGLHSEVSILPAIPVDGIQTEDFIYNAVFDYLSDVRTIRIIIGEHSYSEVIKGEPRNLRVET